MKNKGITLISLVVTAVVVIILAGVGIATLGGDSSTIGNAKTAKMMHEFRIYKDELEEFIVKKTAEDYEFEEGSLSAGKYGLIYDTQAEGERGKGSIKDVIPDMSDDYVERFEIIKGELLIISPSAKEKKVADSLKIRESPYLIEDGKLLSAGTNLDLLDDSGAFTVPYSANKIGAGAFANSSGSGGSALRKIIIPGHVKEIEADAFSLNTTLEEVVMENGVEKVGERAFNGCTALKQITFPDSVTSIGEYCLYKCTNLTQVKLSNNITTIPAYFCRYDSKLASIEIPEGVTNIGKLAFRGCTSMKTITFPSTLQTLEDSALGDTTNLTEIVIPTTNPYLKMQNGVLLSKDGKTVYYALLSLTTITIPEGVTTIR